MSQSEVTVENHDRIASITVIDPRPSEQDQRDKALSKDNEADLYALRLDDVANDDDAHVDKLATPPAEPVGRWKNYVPLQYFFAGSFVATLLLTAGIYVASYWENLGAFEVAAGALALCVVGWLVVLVMQNNRLISEYRDSEVNRVHPHRVIAASRKLSAETASMENRIKSYSTYLAETTDQIHQEAGKLNQGFQQGAEELRLTLTQWDKARHEFSARFNVIKTHIDEARLAIEASITRLPDDAKRTTDEIILNFDSQLDTLIKNLQTSLSTEDKFIELNQRLLGTGRTIETLFADFESKFVNRISDIEPAVIGSITKSAENIADKVQNVVGEIDRQLKNVTFEIQSNNEEFFKQIPDKIEAFKIDSQNVIQQFSDVIGENSRTAVATITHEKAQFEEQYKQALMSLKDYLGDLSKDIKEATTQTEQNFDGFLEKFNFNFMGKLNFFSELIESKTHTFSDQMLDEIELLKKNFGELANSFSQVIESSMMAFDRRAEYTTVEFENHLSGMISKSLGNIATRLDIFEEQVTSRIGKMGMPGTGTAMDPTLATRRSTAPTRYNNDYLSILEQQMSDIHQALYDLKKGGGSPPRK